MTKPSETPTEIRLADYRPPSHNIESVHLEFLLHESGTKVRSRLAIRRQEHADSAELRLHGEGLALQTITINDTPIDKAAYTVDDEGLTLHAPPETFTLFTEVIIAPEKNTALEGLYRSSGMFCTQCEAEGFRKITYYLDRPDVMSVFTVRVEADKDKYPVLLSNGNPGETGELSDGRHFAEWHDPFPKPAYLFALVAGDLVHLADQFTTMSGRTIDLKIYVEPQNRDQIDYAMLSLKRSMTWDEEKYGREYDLDVFNIVAVDAFNMGAMENKGLNIFNSSCVLASQATATDLNYQRIEAVIAHEYFHNWTGNRITCRDWFQLSLKEGLTVYRDQEFSADMGERAVKRIEDVRFLRSAQFPEDASPMAHPVRPASYIEINNFYTLTVYEKGAEVVRMQAKLLGPKTFRKATDLYFERHDGQAVTTDDFVKCMEDASGRNLGQFKHWYDYAGTPEVTASDEYDEATQSYRLTLSQKVPDTAEQSDKPAFHIPVAVGLLAQSGDDIRSAHGGDHAQQHMLELTETTQTFEFTDVSERPVPSLARDMSAPIKVSYPYTDEQLMFLMANDSDGFNRWDAAQALSTRTINTLIDTPDSDSRRTLLSDYIDTFRKTLTNNHVAPALIADVISLPSFDYLGETRTAIDPQAICDARDHLKTQLGQGLRDELTDSYRRLSDDGAFAVDAAAIGRRTLKNVALTYLMAAPTPDIESQCLQHYRSATNMTDTVAALELIARGDHAERQSVLDDFANRWSELPLVMDKWFGAQARSPRADTLTNVQKLMTHPAFSITNPNRLRALVGSFALGNPLRFHAADGSGYEFVASCILEVDKLNPQVAARLLRVFSRWRRYESVRQSAMRTQLERILASDLSNDSYEIASKSLGASPVSS